MIKPATPLPWEAHQGLDESQPKVWDITAKHGWTPDLSDITPQGWYLATIHEVTDPESAAADAAFIVHAANCHEPLVEALAGLLADIEKTDRRNSKASGKARAALSLAQGEKA